VNFVFATDTGTPYFWGMSGTRCNRLPHLETFRDALFIDQIRGIDATRASLLGPDGNLTLALAFRGSTRISDAEITPLGSVSFGAPASNLCFERNEGQDALFGQSMANLKIRAGMCIASRPNESSNRNVRISDRLEKAVSLVTGRDFYFVVEESPKLQLRVTKMKVR